MTGVKGKYFAAPIFMRAIKNARIMRQLTTALFIPEKAMHGMLEGDSSKARAIFEQARHMDLSQFPLPGAEERRERSIVPATPVGGDEKIKKFGTPEWGWNTEV